MTETTESGRDRGRVRSDWMSGAMLIALALYVGWENRAYPIGTLQEPGPGYLPLLLAIFLGAMGALTALRGGNSQTFAALGWHEAPRALLILAACAVATLALERLGYRLTVIALLIFFLGVVERRGPLVTGIVSISFSVATFYIIGTLLKVPLPRSPWGF